MTEAEFLVGMNYWRIADKKFGGSFNTVTVTPIGAVRKGASPRRDWSTRMGAAYLSQVRRVVDNIKDTRFAQEMQQLNGAMNRALDNVIRNNPDPTRALDQQFRARAGLR